MDSETQTPPLDQHARRAQLRRAVERLGWKWVNKASVLVRCERTIQIGPRTIVIRGGVPIDIPLELTVESGMSAAALAVDPTVEAFAQMMERMAANILSVPDDVTQVRSFERPSFFTALEDARRELVQSYQRLENRRIDDRVEAELGLHFYLEGFTTQERSLEYFVGPTNSGKTHAAIEILRSATSGVYLAPLRLLALEVYERLSDLHVPTSLVTGEERVLHPYGTHTSSTVEMVDLGRDFDVAVVDEAQMLEDAQRGWAWTLAIAGVRAKRVVLCGSEEGLHAAQRLAERLGTTLTERRFERKNPLRVVSAIPMAALRPGDAVVGFSRTAVVQMQSEVGRAGFSSAAIYGSLSPLVRRREAERFRSGAADVLVATDAIGLGLNLPIRRIIFAEVEKYDGARSRALTSQEVRQIAGRAGRFGLHEEGLVSALDARDVAFLRRAIERPTEPGAPQPIWISPTDDHLRRLGAILGTTRVGRLLQFFAERVLQDGDTGLRIADLGDTIEVALALELSPEFLTLPFETRCTYSRAPVTTRGQSLNVLAQWGAQHAVNGVVDGSELTRAVTARDRLLLYEDRSRLATLYLWLAQRFPEVYAHQQEVSAIRESIDDDIHGALLERGARSKKSSKRSRRSKPTPRRRR